MQNPVVIEFKCDPPDIALRIMAFEAAVKDNPNGNILAATKEIYAFLKHGTENQTETAEIKD